MTNESDYIQYFANLRQKICKTSESDNRLYPIFCKLASKNVDFFKTFKSNKIYNSIVENVCYKSGIQYIDYFKNNSLIINNIEKFNINYKLRNSEKFEYDIGSFSPTTLQYIKILSDLAHYNLNNYNIVEIGPGYGGQYTIIRQLFKPRKYTFIDLESVLNLIKTYVTTLNLDDIELEYLHHTKLNVSSYDLVISNFALSECDYELQDLYINHIIKNSQHGYILYNNLRGYNHVEFANIIAEKNVSISEEKPKNSENTVLITW